MKGAVLRATAIDIDVERHSERATAVRLSSKT